ncbi:uncharacterized protein LOC118645002 [Monomorium pharaonis]|uniref:uncharacterized protein LOC118645002 n=1 Tax=Monomorium pharaonis TaxID=307658 RepID=UPI0017472BCD|nr:uncharacterized protein LOC118645002 [Monomorium pharaonis]
MDNKTNMLIVKKKRRISIPKNLNTIQSWNIIGPIVAQELKAFDYIPIPYCFDTNAYKIGHIFVPIGTQITCFRRVPVLKILGPIHDFAVKNETNVKWLDKEFRSVRTSGDQMDFRIIIEHGKNQLSFTGRDYYFLSKAYDMSIEGNVVINRAAHEDLLNTKWIGLITNVIVTRIFEFHIVRDICERVIYTGDSEHTILFKYDICEIDRHGTVVKSKTEKIRCKWSPVGNKISDSLPLTKFQNKTSDKT